jgi:hypothetical protein
MLVYESLSRWPRGRLVPNSALGRTVRPVTPVAVGQRARQSLPPVSASVRWTMEQGYQ